MSKNFGYTKRGGKDWFSSDGYSDKEIEAIKDPEGGNEISLPTAIPSPFARIDLVKTAFLNILKTPELKAYTNSGNIICSRNDEKLVSDCLDLAEMLFNIDSIKDKIRIIVWDRESEIEKLKRSSEEHRRFSETLEMYLEQDKTSYNFDLMNRLYLIEYNHKIIGSTSPATLLFTTANDLTHAQLKLTKNDIIFDDKYTPLYERDVEFQKYFHLLFKSNPILSKRMKGISGYLEKNLKILDKTNNSLYEEIQKLNNTFLTSNYSELDTGNAGEIIEVLGIPLRKRKRENAVHTVSSSDFIIKSNKYNKGLMPLALQNNLNKSFIYANDKWDNSIKVQYFDKEPDLDRRWLPGLRIQYPYLTVSDFFEPYLLRLPYNIDSDKYFDGNLKIETGDKKGYLLPLKNRYFDFFDINDIKGHTHDGKPMIELIQSTGGDVAVYLRIPIQKNEYITFERKYRTQTSNNLNTVDETLNEGVIVENLFGLTIFPFIKSCEKDNIHYRVLLIDHDTNKYTLKNSYELRYFTQQSNIPINREVHERRNKNAGDLATTKYYILNHEFDYISINSGFAGGLLIPNWRTYSKGSLAFKFAIDFGTVNTHIEYIDPHDNNTKPFEINRNDLQIANLFSPGTIFTRFPAIEKYILHDFLPEEINNNCDYKFPHRTVITNAKRKINENDLLYSLADFNIPFAFEKEDLLNSLPSTNLKWSTEKDNEKKVRAFFEEIIFLIRNKILLNDGDLDKTEIVCFFPSSMVSGRRKSMLDAWKDYIQLTDDTKNLKFYISPNARITYLSESIAPYYYFSKKEGVSSAHRPVVSIDIGGGTSDISVYLDGQPRFITSFRFAAESIFGDSFNSSPSKNGFVKKYFKGLDNQSGYFKDVEQITNVVNFFNKEPNNSNDTISFLFSLENNSDLKSKHKQISLFSDLSKDSDLKIVFLLFYSAIIYHIAKLMKLKKLDIPRTILLSGKGSKILNIAEGVAGFERLEMIAQSIFKAVYNKEQKIEIAQHKTPKEITCKGGLEFTEKDFIESFNKGKSENDKLESIGRIMDRLQTILIGDDRDSYTEGGRKSEFNYSELNNDLYNSIIVELKNFMKLFFNIYDNLKFSDEFEISKDVKSIAIKLLNDDNSFIEDLKEGVARKKLELNSNLDEDLDETLFFYPLIGAINKLAFSIVTRD